MVPHRQTKRDIFKYGIIRSEVVRDSRRRPRCTALAWTAKVCIDASCSLPAVGCTHLRQLKAEGLMLHTSCNSNTAQ